MSLLPDVPFRLAGAICSLCLAIPLVLISGCAMNEAKTPEPPPLAKPKDIKESPKEAKPVQVLAEKAEQELSAAIASYENGAYRQAARQLQNALQLGLGDALARARAHKYLAFIACVDGRQAVCRDEFRKALEADPNFVLSPAEAGHPTWGPVFRKIKAASVPIKK